MSASRYFQITFDFSTSINIAFYMPNTNVNTASTIYIYKLTQNHEIAPNCVLLLENTPIPIKLKIDNKYTNLFSVFLFFFRLKNGNLKPPLPFGFMLPEVSGIFKSKSASAFPEGSLTSASPLIPASNSPETRVSHRIEAFKYIVIKPRVII